MGGFSHPFVQGALLGEGASGRIFAIANMPGMAIKLYHDRKTALDHRDKVLAMLAAPPDLKPLRRGYTHYPQIAWPEGVVADADNRFAGFVMPLIDQGRSTSLVNLLQKSSRRREGISDYYGYRVLVARNLAAMFAELHRAGHHMIDMKPANLRVYPSTAWVAVVDTDGFSIAGKEGRHPAAQVSDDYIAPESWGRPSASLGEAQDNFTLGAIIFQLLNNGVHPYSGVHATPSRYPSDLQARVCQGLYPYGLTPMPLLRPSPLSIHTTFPDELRAKFDACFIGAGVRPGAASWRDTMVALLDRLTPCTVRPDEHAHFGGACGFCQYERTILQAAVNSRPTPRPVVPGSRRGVAMPARPPIRRGPGVRPMPAGYPGSSASTLTIRRHRMARLTGAMSARLRWPARLVAVAIAGMSIAFAPGWGDSQYSNRRASAPIAQAVRVADVNDAASAQVSHYLVLDDAGTGAPMRSGPGEAFGAVARLVHFEPVASMGSARTLPPDGWVWIMTRDGRDGYIRSSHLMPLASPEPAVLAASDLQAGVK